MPIRPENRHRYPPYWKILSRMIRFGRGQGKCEHCGEVHGSPSTQTGSIVVLTTAHLYDHAPRSMRVRQSRGSLPALPSANRSAEAY